ncbi:MAG: acetoacetate--CoA ligase, partial [Alphaproteobacteria bacterium]|nr:acetoacetate--CoA ligase [Alphaproteobacteria bacterium]
MQQIYWQPSPDDLTTSVLARFKHMVEAQNDIVLPDYAALHRWSVTEPAQFWSDAWDYCGIKGHKGLVFLNDGEKFPGAQWFPEA